METQSFDLGVTERLNMLNMIPSSGDITRVRELREFRERLSFTETERAKWGIIQEEGGHVYWKTSDPVTFEFSDDEVKMIIAALRRMDREKQLTVDMISLWETFIPG